MDWEFSDRVYFVEDEMMYMGFNVVGITEIKDINEKRAFAQAQYTLNEMTIQEIIVTATFNDGTVTPLKLNDYNMDVTSIQEM
ncbi:hypothetical protein [Metabacillus sediminilitoris]|uniref:Uncharacterized protein n=1 Tax=Metabacillus sediminilitoris TaxID=2567941 RepID=A0A4S4BH89_9BACI|nr:hypothetical protein [Metabacillus sediminilitoris]QGQ46376.1 hypothetical protein GMB29_14815 [Metabacillus sediminilitoris]THF73902.1 hypothetical protein E6W99_25995 [Metabacillus sediminilitoris]